MIYEEKLKKIIDKLKEERDLTRKGHKTKVTFYNHTIPEIGIQATCKILLQLQDDEKVIKILDALQPEETVSTEDLISPSNNDDYENVTVITVETNDNFDAWYENYVIQQKSSVSEMTYLNLLRILDTMQSIKEKIQIIKSSIVQIPLLPQRIRFSELMPYDDIKMRDEFIEGRWDSVGYLEKEGAIREYRHINSMMHRWDDSIEVIIIASAFYPFLEKVKQEVTKRLEDKEQKQKEQKQIEITKKPTDKADDNVKKENNEYIITYTQQRQIILNDYTELGKPDFNSENDLVFSFLYKHPNETFTKERIEKEIGSPLTKSLHKIVENLGFKGDTKEAFFSVSKDAIIFRNPVTKEQLKELKSPLIKAISGNGKIILQD